MAKKGKKGKKGKKDKKEKGPDPVTTAQILVDRTKILCPRMGDIFNLEIKVEKILEVYEYLIAH